MHHTTSWDCGRIWRMFCLHRVITAWNNNLLFNWLYVRQVATDSADESLNFKRWWFACSSLRQLRPQFQLVVHSELLPQEAPGQEAVIRGRGQGGGHWPPHPHCDGGSPHQRDEAGEWRVGWDNRGCACDPLSFKCYVIQNYEEKDQIIMNWWVETHHIRRSINQHWVHSISSQQTLHVL